MQDNYLKSITAEFKYYKQMGDKTLAVLSEEELFWQYNAESNSIAVIVRHLWGNMRSRWTDFLTTDGEKEWRNREDEFEWASASKEAVLEKWEAGWACLFAALDTINSENFDTIVFIRNMGHTVIEAVNRQLAHYSYHVGQIVFVGRMIRGADWQSLSIPKGNSQAYNAEKFAQPKRRAHFTKEFLENKGQNFL